MQENGESDTERRKRERLARQAEELRANLKRRKSQARARAATTSAPDPAASAQRDPEESGA